MMKFTFFIAHLTAAPYTKAPEVPTDVALLWAEQPIVQKEKKYLRKILLTVFNLAITNLKASTNS